MRRALSWGGGHILHVAAVVFVLAMPASPAWAIPANPFLHLQELKERPSAPDFTLTTLEGKQVRLREYKGRLVMVNFWATWCAPCRREMPTMERLYRRYRGRGFVILAVNVKEKRGTAQAFARHLRLTFPVLLDSSGQVGLLYGAWGLPATYLIGRRGEVIARGWGEADWDSRQAHALISGLLSSPR